MNDENTLILILVIGSSVTLFLAVSIIGFVIFYQKRLLQKKIETQQLESDHQKRLVQANIQSQEAERKRVASELHDGVGAMLSAAKLNLGMLDHLSQEEKSEVISESKGMLDETIETVRRISKDLLPASLEKFGLNNAIKELCEKLSTTHLQVKYFEESSFEYSLSKDYELPVYRIVQEAINNAIKYANTDQIEVRLAQDSISITDDGDGYNIDTIKQDITKGVGLYNMQNRANLLGADLKIETAPNLGTSVILTFPNGK